MAEDIYHSIPHPGLWADLILIVHALIVCFVVSAQAVILVGWWKGWSWVRNAWFRLAHLVTIVIVMLQAWLGRLCPLTTWEHGLRRAAGQPVYEHTFIEYWVARYLYLDLPWWIFVAGYTLFAALVVWTWWRWPPRRPWKA
ncbi:MAG: DUF2784 domain-containing protein [Wenzhouxiangellaceae bacterium]